MARRDGERGPALLRAALDRTGVRQMRLEDEMDVARGLVSRWLSGERTPGLPEATYLERRFGIPTEAWLSAEDRKAIERVEPVDRPSSTGTDG